MTDLMVPERAARAERDYTCVAGWELAAAFHRYRDRSVPLARIAERLGMDVRDLKKIVNEVKYRTVGLNLADRVLTAIGQNVTHLDLLGEVRVFPTSLKGAQRMARDEFYARQQFGDPSPGPQERRRRPGQLMDLRNEVLERVVGRHPANAQG